MSDLCAEDVHRVFTICDEDGDGVITTAQLRSILGDLGIENVDSIIEEFTSLDEGSGLGLVTYPQFLRGVERCRLGRSISSRFSLSLSDLKVLSQNKSEGESTLIDTASFENAALKEKLVVLEAQLYEFEQKYKIVEKELLKCNNQINKLKVTNGALVADLENAKIDGVRDKEREADLRRTLKQLKAENRVQEEQLRSVNEQLEATQRLVTASPRHSLNRELNIARTGVAQLREKLEETAEQVTKLRAANEQLAAAHQQEQNAVQILEVKIASLNGEIESKDRALVDLLGERRVGKSSILSELEQSDATFNASGESTHAEHFNEATLCSAFVDAELFQLKEQISVLQGRLFQAEEALTTKEEVARDWERRYTEKIYSDSKSGTTDSKEVTEVKYALHTVKEVFDILENIPPTGDCTTVDTDTYVSKYANVVASRGKEILARLKQDLLPDQVRPYLQPGKDQDTTIRCVAVRSCAEVVEQLDNTTHMLQARYDDLLIRLGQAHRKVQVITNRMQNEEPKAQEALELGKEAVTTLQQEVSSLQTKQLQQTEVENNLREAIATKDAELATLRVKVLDVVPNRVDSKHGVYLSPSASATLRGLLEDADPVMDKLEDTARHLHRRLAVLKRKQTAPPILSTSVNPNSVRKVEARKYVSAGHHTAAVLIWVVFLLGIRGWLAL